MRSILAKLLWPESRAKTILYLIVAGALFVVFSLLSYVTISKTLSLVRYSEKTTSRVVTLDKRRGSKSSYFAILEYSDADNGQHQIISSWNVNKRDYAVGTKIPVIYSSINPSVGSIDNFWYIYGDDLFSIALTILYAVLFLHYWGVLFK